MAKSKIAKQIINVHLDFFFSLQLEIFCDWDTFWQYLSLSFEKSLSPMHVILCQAHGSDVLAGTAGTYTCSTGLEIIKQSGKLESKLRYKC